VIAPDLIVTDITGPKGAKSGDLISGRVYIRNQGTAWTAIGFDVEIFLSTDAQIDPLDISLGTVSTSWLDWSSNRYIDFTKWIPPYVDRGNYYLGAIVDSGDVIFESDETNNGGASADTMRIR
jgi:hypothetical protein